MVRWSSVKDFEPKLTIEHKKVNKKHNLKPKKWNTVVSNVIKLNSD